MITHKQIHNSRSIPQITINLCDGEVLPTYTDLGVIISTPKHPHFALKIHRLRTFDTWSTHNHVSKTELIDSGFFYSGNDDTVKCFYCDLVLSGWSMNEVPWIEHAKKFTQCDFLIQMMGESFITAVELGRHQLLLEFISKEMKKLTSYLNGPAVRVVRENTSFSFWDIKRVFNKLRNCQNSVGVYQHLNTKYVLPILPHDDNEIAKIIDRITVIRNAQKCLICLKYRAEAIFFPCLHLNVCYLCSLSLQNCAICRSIKTGILCFKKIHEQQIRDSTDPNERKDQGLTLLQLELKYLEQGLTCVDCKTSYRKAVFLPCRHITSCETCALKARSCSYCERRVVGVCLVYHEWV